MCKLTSLSKRKGVHLFLLFLVAVTLIQYCIEIYHNPQEMVDFSFGVLHTILLLCFLFSTKFACCSVVVLYCISSLLPDVYSLMQIFGLMFAIGYLAFSEYLLVGISLSIVVLSFDCIGYWLYEPGGDICIFIFTESIYLVCVVLIGVVFKLKRKHEMVSYLENKMEILSEKNINHARSERMSELLHDSIASDLTYVVLLSENGDFWEDKRSVSSNLKSIHDVSLRGLESVHDAIRLMRGDLDAEDNSEKNSLWEAVETCDHYLKDLGFSGEFLIEGKLSLVENEIIHTMVFAIKEICINIAKYSDPNNRIFFSRIVFSDRKIIFIAKNSIFDRNDLRGGSGLTLVKKRVALVGGVVFSWIENNYWMTYIEIPVS